MIRRISSGGPYEDMIGYCRAVVAGPFVLVSPATMVAVTALIDRRMLVEVEVDAYRDPAS